MSDTEKSLIAALLTAAATIGSASEDVVMERYTRICQRVAGKDPNIGPMKAFWDRIEMKY